MDIIFIKDYTPYKIDTVVKNVKTVNAERLISLGVCEEVKKKRKSVKKQLDLETK